MSQFLISRDGRQTPIDVKQFNSMEETPNAVLETRLAGLLNERGIPSCVKVATPGILFSGTVEHAQVVARLIGESYDLVPAANEDHIGGSFADAAHSRVAFRADFAVATGNDKVVHMGRRPSIMGSHDMHMRLAA